MLFKNNGRPENVEKLISPMDINMDHTEQKLHDIKGGNKYRVKLGLKAIFPQSKKSNNKKMLFYYKSS